MAILNVKMPNIDLPGMRNTEKIGAMHEYLLMLEKQLEFVLGNLDEENMNQAWLDRQAKDKAAASDQLGQMMTRGALLDTVYPVGSIYMSAASTSPQALFGGTWEAVDGLPVNAWKRTA